MRDGRTLLTTTLASLLLALAAVGCGLADETGDGAAEAKALEAAQTWLALVDAGDYQKSWETAAVLFRNAVTPAQWQQSMQAARQPLGAVIERKAKSKRYATSLPGAPDGEYVVIQFETSFANKKSGVETVTPMLDPDGEWRVSGYYIK